LQVSPFRRTHVTTAPTAGSGLKIDITGVSDDRGSYLVLVHQARTFECGGRLQGKP